PARWLEPTAEVSTEPGAVQSGKDIWLWGSLQLMHTLLHAGVVDEVRMLVCPASRDKGTQVFEDRRELKLLEASSFHNGVVFLRYQT
ncbi:hypothetical protein ACFFMR_32735, partial [Micromonospora andamanensis]